MQKRTLPRQANPGWTHPYGHDPFAPYLYADGGDGGDSASGDSNRDGDNGGTDGGAGGDDADDDGQAAEPEATAQTGDGGQGEDQTATIARLQKDLKAANAEAAKARTDAKQKAADEARATLAQDLMKVLDPKAAEKEKPDPAKLTAEIERATAEHRETAIELAVYKGASTHGADPGALTDSRAFLSKLGRLDPAEEGFTRKVSEAIKAAVTDNPKLKAATPPPATVAGDFGGGTGEETKGGPKTIDEIRAERRKRRAG